MKQIIILLCIVFLCNILIVAQKNKSNSPFSEIDSLKTHASQSFKQGVDHQLKPEELQRPNEYTNNEIQIIEYQKSLKNFKILVFSLFGFFFLIIVIGHLILFKSLSRDNIINQVLGSKRIAEKFASKNNNNRSYLEKPYVLTEKDINIILDRVMECVTLSEKENQFQANLGARENYDPQKSTTKYLKGKSGKVFSRVENTPENSFFRLFNENADVAQFEFYGDEAEAIAKRIFSEDVCNILSGSYQNAKLVKTIKPGKIKRVGEQWEVIEPVEIKLF